ncbi:hypothetical protein PF008_g11653 [Phytophthora fragariae]|uniref:Integrase catalytic domain-containing protein n=1 Tax=Phytophthora fragariae TaxID=53985 RepID=A0A6G0RQC3_9STRA|nr:hypothetical protein PF008_g11653 [Phytophthora fragariae]
MAPVAAEVTADGSAELFLDLVFRHDGLPESIVSDRDPRFTSAFWTRLFALLGTHLLMPTAAHPETDGQTERVNRVLGDVLGSYGTSFASWSSFLPMAEYAQSNSTRFYAVLREQRAAPARSGSAGRPKFEYSSGPHSWWGGLVPTSKSTQDSSEPPLP